MGELSAGFVPVPSLGPGVVAGGYRLDHLLGKGGMGQVWAATHQETRRTAALKFLTRPTHLEVETRRRFLREARAANSVNHPNVVKIHDVFELGDGTPVLVMDLLEGETLGRRLERTGPQSLGQTADLLLPVVSAVGRAHALGIIHRDLKPDNVFLANRAQGGIEPLVLDFGVAKLMTAGADDTSSVSALTGTGTMLGTPAYMAPEQTLCEKDVDHRADIWAIGVLMYESLSGVRPVDWNNLGQMVRHFMTHRITPIETLCTTLPQDISSLIGAMLQRDRSSRPSDLREVYTTLLRYTAVRSELFPAPLTEAQSRSEGAVALARIVPRLAVLERDASGAPEAIPISPPDSGAAQSLLNAPRTVRGVSFGAGAILLSLAAIALSTFTRRPEVLEEARPMATATTVPLSEPRVLAAPSSPKPASAAPPAPSAMAQTGSVVARPASKKSGPGKRTAGSAVRASSSPAPQPSGVAAPSVGLLDEVPF